MPAGPITPQALLDLYNLLPDTDRQEFLRLLGSQSTAKVPLLLVKQMPPEEQARYASSIHKAFWQTLLPVFLREAARLAREQSSLTDAQLQGLCLEACAEYGRQQSRLARAEVKARRDRKSDARTVKRNLEICDLHRRDPGTWSLKKLAGKYKVSREAVVKVLRREGHWRRLAAGPANESGTN
jgi:hypothetical protein